MIYYFSPCTYTVVPGLIASRYYPLFSNIVYNDRPSTLPNSQLSTSSDPVLTALAQLALHRTNTRRALVSLFDSKWQYIVAEATPDLPLGPTLSHTERNGEDLWMCGTAVPRSSGICEHSLDLPVPRDLAARDLPTTFVPDLHDDDRLPKKTYCFADHPVRFYAAVPIRTTRDIDIGVLCVMDNHPMEGDVDWKKDKVDGVLSGISATIMSHLESERLKLEHRRSQRMVRGVGSFVEMASTLTDWQEGSDPSSFEDVAGAEGALNVTQQAMQPQYENNPGMANSDTADTRQRTLEPSANVVRTTQHESAQQPHPSGSFTRERTAVPPQQGSVNDIFSRAANLIRESIEVEGVIFLDVNSVSFGSRVKWPSAHASAPASSTTVSSSDEASSGPERTTSDRCCPVLGFSTSDVSSIDNEQSTVAQITLPGKVLATLLRRYPGGKIWNFDEHGSLHTGDSSEEDSSAIYTPRLLQRLAPSKQALKTRPWARQREGTVLAAIFPGARSVAFVPIWNEKSRRWHSGCFVYSFRPTRFLTVTGELSYLRAFAVLVIAEVLRHQASLEIKAQNDILNSISHELRSPLHGVILGVELLQDTGLDTFQGNIIHTVETCGRTLLDTIDHLLDYSNVNNFLHVDKREEANKGSSGLSMVKTGMKNLLVEMNLDALVEEVVESVYAGHNFQRLSVGEIVRAESPPVPQNQAHRHLDRLKSDEDLGHARNTSNRGTPTAPNESILIRLDIEPEVHRYLTTVGAIRRIVMNLFGNALKYTQRGAIRVALTRVSLVAKKHKGRRYTVCITVSDTGHGISEDYLKHKLFKPFHQEDDLSPGTGLGLSLVKGIVDSLHGEISIQSQLNVGTTATVLLPLKPADTKSGESDLDFLNQRRELKGLRVHLSDLPQRYAAIRNQYFPNEKTLPSSSLETVFSDWLYMEVVQGKHAHPDIVLCSETAIDNDEGLLNIGSKAPVVVLCNNPVSAHNRTMLSKGYMNGRIVEYISQP